jgi:hypothetical protein
MTYRVIRKSLRDFRPLRYISRVGHAKGEHVNRGRGTPSFCPTLQVLDMSFLLCLPWLLRSRVRKLRRDLMDCPVLTAELKDCYNNYHYYQSQPTHHIANNCITWLLLSTPNLGHHQDLTQEYTVYEHRNYTPYVGDIPFLH